MKKTCLFLLICLFATDVGAQTILKLWNGNPPTSNGITESEKQENWRISNVTEPDIAVYLPEKSKNTRTAVIICPGGGYSRLAYDHEGIQFAEWLKSQGIAGIILKYRLPNGYKEIPLQDAQQAISIVRSKANEWDIDQNKVGIAGFSAGGHLASTASTHFTSGNTRPDFSILFYPVITMKEGITHGGSRYNLLGKSPSLSDLHIYSNEKQVNANTPPTIIMLSDDDKAVIPQNSIMYYDALKKNSIPATMYVFPTGGHGWGMNTNFKYHNQMLSLLKLWLEATVIK
ncbi:alpha/beta hydrolase [Dysgonomonas sp. 216]|uniref:alpha/beta hydrolase n=1 Tax=Dysgonomonas sp. 216 TaxID=2302934 RepID=UPI0013CFC431|nr:alpha/beta hydrolase [Dysgonomonas sp. 216]NDW19662.1 alpha/beta hydrolase [Dysgonomonas sp. 216]